jgi:hypothetical protein
MEKKRMSSLAGSGLRLLGQGGWRGPGLQSNTGFYGMQTFAQQALTQTIK